MRHSSTKSAVFRRLKVVPCREKRRTIERSESRDSIVSERRGFEAKIDFPTSPSEQSIPAATLRTGTTCISDWMLNHVTRFHSTGRLDAAVYGK
ncbi:hypothetical protein CDAR_497551 [Caerostris darwini]|uniref:Uncharacterized protein n=1 Tax=Caerostris darwini TaxID=1538125 RepID=A0AAV4RZ84_9ARAC|nr:hypothetical protein CDAR_497551 [Caerostris darwini]